MTYDEAGQWIGNYGAAGQPQQQAIWLDNYPVALINQPGAGISELAYIQPDHLGSPRVVIDPIRDVAIWEWSSKSEAFGNQTPNADPDGDGAAFELALRFPGQQSTNASGMFYNYQRDYDPAVGRYPQSDPIGLAGGISTFSYVQGSPISNWDSTGLQLSSRHAIGRAGANTPYLPADQGNFDPGRPGFESTPATGPIIYPGEVLVTWIQVISTLYPAIPRGIDILASIKEPGDARDPAGTKAPGLPGSAEGYCPGKKGPKWVRSPNCRSFGWENDGGNDWISTGPKTEAPNDAHGGAHWDVQLKRGGYTNKYPGGHTR